MGRARVAVVDTERAIAEAIASAIQAALPEVIVAVGDDHRADVVVSTWPSGRGAARGPGGVVLLGATASPVDAHTAKETEPAVLVSRTEPLRLIADAVLLALRGVTFVSPAAAALLDAPPAPSGDPIAFTAAESRLVTELAFQPDTRSRLAAPPRDQHLDARQPRRCDQAQGPCQPSTSGNVPTDGYLSMEALIGWATRQQFQQKN